VASGGCQPSGEQRKALHRDIPPRLSAGRDSSPRRSLSDASCRARTPQFDVHHTRRARCCRLLCQVCRRGKHEHSLVAPPIFNHPGWRDSDRAGPAYPGWWREAFLCRDGGQEDNPRVIREPEASPRVSGGERPAPELDAIDRPIKKARIRSSM
jgi:hypothetical protein